MLHIAELGPRTMLAKLDGKTLGPNKYRGEIGCLLDTVTDRPIFPDFVRVDRWPPPEIPEDIVSGMCADQKYMLRIYEIVRTGKVL